MIVSHLGSTTGDIAAKGAAVIPVVGPVAAGLIKLMDALLPTTKFCDPRSQKLMAQIAMDEHMAQDIHPGAPQTEFQQNINNKRIALINEYEADCKAGLTTAPYIHCMNMTDERSKLQCEQAVTRKLRLREAAARMPTAATPTTPWYKNPLVWGGGAVAALGAYLLLR